MSASADQHSLYPVILAIGKAFLGGNFQQLFRRTCIRNLPKLSYT